MIRYILNLIVFVLSTINVQGQAPIILEKLTTIEGAFSIMEIDKIGNLFLVDQHHRLTKRDKTGKTIYTFSENRLGPIRTLDVSNPLQILVYFDDYAHLLVLDRTLSDIRRQDLNDLMIQQIRSVGIATDNNIWIYDSDAFMLKKLDPQNNLVQESLDLSLLIEQEIVPNKILELNNTIYVLNQSIGILFFDNFANFIYKLDIPNLKYFQIINDAIYYLSDNQLHQYHLPSASTHTIDLVHSTEQVKQISIGQGYFYILHPTGVDIYQIKK